MNRWINRLVWVGGIFFLTLCLVVLMANYFLNRPAFKTHVERQVSRALKMPVQFEVLKLKWNGIRIKNLNIPYEQQGASFAQAKGLGFSFNFWRLLRGQMILDSIDLNAPQVLLLETPKGKIELPRLTKEKIAESEPLPLPASTITQLDEEKKEREEKRVEETSKHSFTSEEFRPRSRNRLGVDQVKIRDGLFQYRDHKQKIKVSCEGIEGDGDFFTSPDEMKSRGEIQVESILIDSNIKITQFESPVVYTNEILLLPEIQAKLYRGTMAGFFRARFDKESKPFRNKLQIRDFDLKTFLDERIKEGSPIEGRSDLNFEGRGQFENAKAIEGTGDFLVKSFRAEGIKFFREIGQVIGAPGLSDVKFEQIIGQFHVKDEHVVFDRVETKPKTATTYLIGKGTIDFEGNLNFSGTLTLNSSLIGNLTQLLQKIRVKSSDGMISVPFHVTGTTDEPKIRVEAPDFAENAIKGLFDLVPEIKF